MFPPKALKHGYRSAITRVLHEREGLVVGELEGGLVRLAGDERPGTE